MRSMRLGVVWLAVAMLALAEAAGAQSTTGTISGRVVDTQERSVPGVTVSVESPNLQGVRTAVTSENGDYIFTLLPSGQYTIRFELSGFQNQERVVTVAPTQVVPIDITMGLAGVSETVDVVGRAADVLTQTAQVATNFSQDLIASLPTNRTLAATMLLAPAVHATGPSGNFSIAGSMSFENLFMVNGVTVNENLRGQALNVYIEDAIQETTIATAGVSAEYGRFGGGVVNIITKSGGNLFSGSFRDSLVNDNWRALVPKREGDTFANDSKIDLIVPTYEYTFGGPVVRDRLWFFTAGRFQKQKFNRQLVETNIPYTATNDSKRYEGNATYSLNSNHRFQGSFIKESLDQFNNTFSQAASMDLASLEDRRTPQNLFTLSYSGILTPSFFIEGRYSQRNFTFAGSGSKFTDPIKGTLLITTTGRRFWSPTFCGVCTDEQRDNQDIFVKGSYFLSTSDYGSHNVVVGYDNFDDIRAANNHQSGSDYRIINLTPILQGTAVIPAAVSGTTQIQWNPIFIKTQGSDFRTHSIFANDNWRVSDRITANIGLRFDKNHGVNGNGTLVADAMGLSPRVGVVYDPTGAAEWSVTGSVAKYLAGLSNTIADVSSPAGNSDQYRFVYRGPSLNTDPAGPTLSTEQVIQSVFDWFNANGGANLAVTGTPSVRGVSPVIGNDLKPPHTWEYSAGISRQYGARAAIRADFTYRDYNDFYVFRTDASTGRVPDDRSFAPAAVRGRPYDLAIVENTNDLERRYSGLTVQSQYRFHARLDVGGSYTISRAWGNVDGENVTSGPLSDSALQYPEYKQAAWNYPEGDLSIDQRHRARLWLNFGIPRVEGLSLGLLQALESGAPYSATNQNAALFNGVDPRSYVTLPAGHPGYVTPPDGGATQYFFTDRDAFHLEAHRRTDLAANYRFDIPAGGRRIGLFVQAQIINLFNQFQRCACGDNVFNNGGTVQNGFINTNVRTNVTHPTLYSAFNPFTTQPQEGVHWAKDPAFGKALNRFAYTTPRMFRIGFGVRF
jgi:outer membrane receptor for ferrienterochelin and colicin